MEKRSMVNGRGRVGAAEHGFNMTRGGMRPSKHTSIRTYIHTSIHTYIDYMDSLVTDHDCSRRDASSWNWSCTSRGGGRQNMELEVRVRSGLHLR